MFLIFIRRTSFGASCGRLSMVLVSSIFIRFQSSWNDGIIFSDCICKTNFSKQRDNLFKIRWTIILLGCTWSIALWPRSMSMTFCINVETSYWSVMRMWSHQFNTTIISDMVFVWNIVLKAFHASRWSAIWMMLCQNFGTRESWSIAFALRLRLRDTSILRCPLSKGFDYLCRSVVVLDDGVVDKGLTRSQKSSFSRILWSVIDQCL